MSVTSERDSLVELCGRLGAERAQAGVMADQLLKRCGQLAAERGITREASMAHLLQLVAKGSQGEAPPGFEGVKSQARGSFVR